jgi:hypothetical protein
LDAMSGHHTSFIPLSQVSSLNTKWEEEDGDDFAWKGREAKRRKENKAKQKERKGKGRVLVGPRARSPA